MAPARRPNHKGKGKTLGPWIVAVDGSYDHIAGWGSWAWVVGARRPKAASGPCKSSTEAELRAVLAALVDSPSNRDVVVLGDCKPIVDAMASKSSDPVRWTRRQPQLDTLWVAILSERDARRRRGLRVEIRWVRGHDGHGLN